MIKNCPICGKAFDVLWPQMWRYRRDGIYLCSYTCLRAYERKDREEMTSISREQKDKAVQIALDGGDPKPFLKECGSKAPDKLWYYIKNVLKKKDPETYEKLAKTARVRKQVETPEGEFAQVKVDGPIRIQTETPEKITFVDGGLLPKVTGIEYKVTGISTSAGDFQYFRRQGYLDWTTLNGETVSMNLEEWKEFMKLFPEVLNVLGVEL